MWGRFMRVTTSEVPRAIRALGAAVSVRPAAALRRAPFVVALSFGLGLIGPLAAPAQDISFDKIVVEGNTRIDAETVLSYADLRPGQPLSEAELNAAYQRIMVARLFRDVELRPEGAQLVIAVKEFSTINRISFEGNNRVADELMSEIIKSKPNRIYSPAQAEQDAAALAEGYANLARFSATVTPRVIRRSDDRVDLVFEVTEGKVIEVERITILGNRAFSDRRLRQVLGTKQAGLLRQIIKTDTFIPERVETDKTLLTDFYRARGYIDFQVLSANTEFVRGRDGNFVTYVLREGQRFSMGQITAVSEVPGVDAAAYQAAIKIKPGAIYSPVLIDNTISRLEALALKQGLDFVNIEPRVTRDARTQTLDVAFALVRSPRRFVERIDIEGNATTVDRVIRRQFRTAEGDPFNPREITDSAKRIRALGFFSEADVKPKPGTADDQVIVDVNVTEKPTGSLAFGLSYGVSAGAGGNISFSEQNFLGRGQALSFSFDTTTDTRGFTFGFTEPAVGDRDLKFRMLARYKKTTSDYADYDTNKMSLSPSLEFPVGLSGSLEVRTRVGKDEILNVDRGSGTETGSSYVLRQEEGARVANSIGYTYTYDTRRLALDPSQDILLRFGQDLTGLGGDTKSLSSTGLVTVQRRVMNEDVTLRAEVEGGALVSISGNSRVTDRFFLKNQMRGFEPNGIGPRDMNVDNEDALGGNLFAVARFEADFPLGLPEEYGLNGGVFWDLGSVWSLDSTAGGTDGTSVIDDGFNLRSALGVSLYWDTAIGPLRFNFSRAVLKESYDKTQNFDLTISTRF